MHAGHHHSESASMAAGRMCPADYRYPPSVFRRDADFAADILYVVGGLYGNAEALGEIERMAAAEPLSAHIVFNGDFHWFDAQPDWFAAVHRRALSHRAICGNIEKEIARETDVGAGCGCAYPPNVSEQTVGYSNAIIARLRHIAQSLPGVRDALAALPMHCVADVAGRRIGIVHGDAWSLAGWRFAHDALDDPALRTRHQALRGEAGVDVFASTHTCLPALRTFHGANGKLTIVNNGAAGMPNFRDTRFGLISRISTIPSPHRPVYGTRHGALHVDALAVHYDADSFAERFLAVWPEGSPAHRSYFSRLNGGPAFTPAQAMPLPVAA